MSLAVDHKYAGFLATQTRNFKRKTARLYNMACPICGDSASDTRKARGYIYERGDCLLYSCHNCGVSTNMERLLEAVDTSLMNAYRMENFQERGHGRTVPEFVIASAPRKPKTDRLDEVGLVRLSSIKNPNQALVYAMRRGIPKDLYEDLWYADDTRKLERLSDEYAGRMPRDERLVIPFRDTGGRLTGVTGRSLDPRSTLRYAAVRLTDDPLIYGLERINLQDRVWVFEGQIDAMMVPNAVAPGGTDMSRAIRRLESEADEVVLVFDNEPRNASMVIQVERYAAVSGRSMVIWPSSWKYKDVGEAVEDGVSRTAIRRVLEDNIYTGPALAMAVNNWKRTRR